MTQVTYTDAILNITELTFDNGVKYDIILSLLGYTGLQGPGGSNGIDGQDGDSAYEVAVANGFVGTEAQWLASLVGPRGLKGDAFFVTGVTTTAEFEASTPATNELVVLYDEGVDLTIDGAEVEAALDTYFGNDIWKTHPTALTGAEIKTAYEGELDTNAFTDAEKSKLTAIEAGATQDQTGAEIKALYEAEADTNAFTDLLLTKLNAIEAGATADLTGAEIKTLYESQPDTNPFTDLLLSKLNGIQDNATDDQTALEIIALLDAQFGGTSWSDAPPSALTDAEIKTAYENNADTNAFTDALLSKLNGIEASATADLTAAEIEALLDAYYGNTDWRTGGGGGSTTFAALTDTPANFTGQALKAIRVNAGETALEFTDFPAGGGSGGSGPQPATDESANRVLDTVYQNTSGYPLLVIVGIGRISSTAQNQASFEISVDNSTWTGPDGTNGFSVHTQLSTDGVLNNALGSMLVPDGYYYRVRRDIGDANLISKVWVEQIQGGGGLADAPSDGSLYARRDGAWEAFTPGSGGGGGGMTGYEATDYANADGTGDRTSTITVTTDATITGSISNAVDGATGNNTTDSFYFSGGQSGRTVTFDFANNPVRIDEMRWIQSSSVSQGTWRVEGSDDNSAWDVLSSDFTLGTPATCVITLDLLPVNKGYRYYRLAQQSGSTSISPYIYEVEFKTAAYGSGPGAPPGQKTISGAYSLTDDDLAGDAYLTADTSGGACTITVPDTLSGTGTVIIERDGANDVTIVAGGTTTLQSPDSNLKLRTNYSQASITPKGVLGTNVYTVGGDLTA